MNIFNYIFAYFDAFIKANTAAYGN